MRVIARDFVEAKPDVLFAGSTPGVLALLAETRTLPIVFTNLNDPVGTGAVASFARPGGNATGFTAFEYSLAGKWLEMLKEVAPAARRIALVFNPETAPYARHYLTFIQAAAPALGVTANSVAVGSVAEMEAAVEAHARSAGGALVALPEGFIVTTRASLIALAARLRLPAIYPARNYVVEGGLLSYGPATTDLYRRSASYVDRILKGEKPADLPVQQPTKFELVINLKTANVLGLTVTPTLLARADEVIE